VAWTHQAAANRRHWGQTQESHLSEWYDIDAFRSGSISIDDLQISEVGDVSGKSLLHLQCNAGIDTLSWARLGARATGIDIAAEPLAAGRRIANELGIPATFIQSDVYAVPDLIDERFDIVYTSQGVLCWLNDLRRWAGDPPFQEFPHSGFAVLPMVVFTENMTHRMLPHPTLNAKDAHSTPPRREDRSSPDQGA